MIIRPIHPTHPSDPSIRQFLHVVSRCTRCHRGVHPSGSDTQSSPRVVTCRLMCWQYVMALCYGIMLWHWVMAWNWIFDDDLPLLQKCPSQGRWPIEAVISEVQGRSQKTRGGLMQVYVIIRGTPCCVLRVPQCAQFLKRDNFSKNISEQLAFFQQQNGRKTRTINRCQV